MLDLVSTLKGLHSAECRHGNLKPENILHFKGGEGVFAIIDIGVSKAYHYQATGFRQRTTTTSVNI